MSESRDFLLFQIEHSGVTFLLLFQESGCLVNYGSDLATITLWMTELHEDSVDFPHGRDKTALGFVAGLFVFDQALTRVVADQFLDGAEEPDGVHKQGSVQFVALLVGNARCVQGDSVDVVVVHRLLVAFLLVLVRPGDAVKLSLS